MGYQYVTVERDGPLTLVTMNRPEVLNALHSPAHFEMHEVFDAFAADPDQWVAIVTGAGDRAFSAGNDLKHQAAGGDMSNPPTSFAGLCARFDLSKPVIAAVNGLAMGGGFETALACDIIIADERAVFALPEGRVGLAAMGGGLFRLPRAVGAQRALGMILTGRRVTAAEGAAMGFVNEVVPAGQARAVARRWAEEILACGPLSVRASKAAVHRGYEEPSAQAAYFRLRDYPEVKVLLTSDDFVEGPKAFSEKRAPTWKGR